MSDRIKACSQHIKKNLFCNKNRFKKNSTKKCIKNIVNKFGILKSVFYKENFSNHKIKKKIIKILKYKCYE